MKQALKNICLCLPFVLMVACSEKIVYFEYQHLPLSGWNADSIVSFSFSIPDTSKSYDAIISVRHTNRYPYQNMWLFIERGDKEKVVLIDSLSKVSLVEDTIEFYLADNYGRWLGNGYSSSREMPVLYLQNEHFNTTDTIQFSLRQAMREESLKGVSQVGLKIVESNN